MVPLFAGGATSTVGVPPLAGTRMRPGFADVLNTMVSSEPHVPPRVTAGAAQMSCGAPPVTATFLSMPKEEKAIHWPSGEKNGDCGFGVPLNGTASNRSVSRRYN